MNETRVSVIGLGYIGLPTASLIASKGYLVNGYDNNQNVINNINKLSIDENETGLIELTSNVLKKKQLNVSTNLVTADYYIITVPTPLKTTRKGKKPDLTYVFQAIKEIIKLLKPHDTIILESTCPPGTTEEMLKIICQKITFTDTINIAYCPERVLPGHLLKELQNNDRIVGGINEKSSIKVSNFYKIFCNGRIHQTTSLTAELVKLAENSYRDVNIAFANSISLIADKANIPVNEIIKLSNFHPRVNILHPGIGVGGHCIPVDPYFLIDKYPDETSLILEARKVNDFKTINVLNAITKKIDTYELQYNKKSSIICLGLSYKIDSNDLRESPAKKIYDKLIDKNYLVSSFEPNILKHKPTEEEIYKVISKYDIIIKLVNHKSFRFINQKLISLPKILITFD